MTIGVSVGAEKVSLMDMSVTKGETEAMNQWVAGHLLDAKSKLPFSFVYDGKTSEALLAEWPKKVASRKLDNLTGERGRPTDCPADTVQVGPNRGFRRR